MTEKEIIRWLGFMPGDDRVKGKKLVPEIVTGMAGIKNPSNEYEQIAAFRAFLRCAPIPEKAIFQAIKTRQL